MTSPAYDYAFTGRSGLSGLLPMNEPREKRLSDIEQALKFDPHHPYRRELVREYLDLTDPEEIA